MLPQGLLKPGNTVLTGKVLFGFVNTFLLSRFDGPVATPEAHIEWWDVVTSDEQRVAIAAPRGHAKSTSISLAYALALVLFKVRDFVLLVSDTEGQAVEFLGDLKRELLDNAELRDVFGVGKILRDTETDLIVRLNNGFIFRVIAKGSNQKVRGLKWHNKRPNAIIGDDLENDEIVLNDERRVKFRNWINNALIPSGSGSCLYRFVGTILHLDSWLERLMPDEEDSDTVVEPLRVYTKKKKAWFAIKYRAHPALNDFSSLLWPDMYDETRLRDIRQLYIDDGSPEGYSQEYLNNPIDEEHAIFKVEDFRPIPTHQKDQNLEYYIGIDLAISEKDRRAFTVFAVAGMNATGKLRYVDIRRFRTNDAYEIIDLLFRLNTLYHPGLIGIEDENISRALGSVLEKEQMERNIFLPILTGKEKIIPSKDKVQRARPLQARMRSGMVEWDTDAEWFPGLLHEFIYFPRGAYKDQVDACGIIALMIDKLMEGKTKKEIEEEEYEQELEEYMMFDLSGRDELTGY